MHCTFELVHLGGQDQGLAAVNKILCNVSALICCQMLRKLARTQR